MEVYQLSNILHDGIRPLHSLKHWRYHNTEEACHGNPFSRMSEQPFSHPGEEETTMMGLRIASVCPIGSRVLGGTGSPGPFLPPSAKSSGSLVCVRSGSRVLCDGRTTVH